MSSPCCESFCTNKHPGGVISFADAGKAADGQHDDHREYRGEEYRVAATAGGNYDFESRDREQSEKCGRHDAGNRGWCRAGVQERRARNRANTGVPVRKNPNRQGLAFWVVVVR